MKLFFLLSVALMMAGCEQKPLKVAHYEKSGDKDVYFWRVIYADNTQSKVNFCAPKKWWDAPLTDHPDYQEIHFGDSVARHYFSDNKCCASHE